jgi:hypothetical protein
LLYKHFNIEKAQRLKSHTKEPILALLVKLEPQEFETYTLHVKASGIEQLA